MSATVSQAQQSPSPAAMAGARAPTEREEIVITPRRGWIGIDWGELWRYRELLYFLTLRELKGRYRQSVFGMAWVVFQPVFTMIVFTVIFGKLAKIPSGDLPYPVFVYAGILPWSFFAASVGRAASSLVAARNLVTNVYFPRLLLPASGVACAAVELGISFCVYACLLVAYGITPPPTVVFVPLLVVLTAMVSVGIGCTFAALNAYYRDFSAIANYTTRILMYLTPVVYPVSIVPRKWQFLLALNPMAGLIGAYRSAILGQPWNMTIFPISSAMSVAILFLGLYLFRRAERRVADVI